MAEQVQAVLDQMVAPLRDLMDRGIFSQSEVRSIVARRRESEYLLRRRAARKADYLRYIDAEMSLEKLRAIRTRQVLGRQARSTGKKNADNKTAKKSHIGDGHIVAHIHFLYTRMLRKFRSDVSLHLQHAAFAKESKSFTRLGRIYSEALQVHPRHVGLWIEAASLEFFGYVDEKDQRVGGGSVQNARVLLQRGLRVNPNSQDLWLQYFALEFHHIQKLRGRREILQLEGSDNVNDKGGHVTETNSEQDECDTSLFSHAPIATVVYKNAIKAIPDNVTFRLKFLDMLKLFPETDAVEPEIMNSIEADFHDKPDAWIARANYVLEQGREELGSNRVSKKDERENAVVGFTTKPSDSDSNPDDNSYYQRLHPRKKHKGDQESFHDEVISVLQEGTNQIPTFEMYLRCVQFARSYMDELAEGSEALEVAKSFVEDVFRKASEAESRTSVDLVMEHAEYLVSDGLEEDAANVVEAFLNDSTRSRESEPLIWINLARLVEQLDPPRSASQVLRKAVKQIPIRHSGHMTVMLELLSSLLNDVQHADAERANQRHELQDLFQRLLLLSPGQEYRGSREDSGAPDRTIADVASQYLKYTMDDGGVLAARKVYTTLFQSNYCESVSGKTPHEAQVMKELFDECVEVEKSSNLGNHKNARKEHKKKLRLIYDVAISFFRDGESALADSYRQRLDEDVKFAYA